MPYRREVNCRIARFTTLFAVRFLGCDFTTMAFIRERMCVGYNKKKLSNKSRLCVFSRQCVDKGECIKHRAENTCKILAIKPITLLKNCCWKAKDSLMQLKWSHFNVPEAVCTVCAHGRDTRNKTKSNLRCCSHTQRVKSLNFSIHYFFCINSIQQHKKSLSKSNPIRSHTYDCQLVELELIMTLFRTYRMCWVNYNARDSS